MVRNESRDVFLNSIWEKLAGSVHARKIVFWFLFIFFFFSFPIFIWFLRFELISFCRLKTENRFCLECFGEDQRAKGENPSAEADDDEDTKAGSNENRGLG